MEPKVPAPHPEFVFVRTKSSCHGRVGNHHELQRIIMILHELSQFFTKYHDFSRIIKIFHDPPTKPDETQRKSTKINENHRKSPKIILSEMIPNGFQCVKNLPKRSKNVKQHPKTRFCRTKKFGPQNRSETISCPEKSAHANYRPISAT